MNGMTASKMFYSANKVMEAYHNVLRPLCKKTGLPPMAVDILMFISNNPDNNTARDICLMRGLKSGIVSVHVERLVNEGLLTRETVPNDRRKTRLVLTPAAADIVKEGRKLQIRFGHRLLEGISPADIEVFRKCLSAVGENIEDMRRNGLEKESEDI